MINIKGDTDKRKKIIGSIFIALLVLSSNMLLLFQEQLGTTLPYKVGIVLIGIFSLLYFKAKIYAKDIVIICVISVFFLMSFWIADNSYLRVYFEAFLSYGLCGLMYSFCKNRVQYVLNASWIIGILWFFICVLNSPEALNDSFGFGYLVLPITVSSFMSTIDKSNAKLIRIVALFAFCFSLYYLIMYGSRGPVVSFALSLLIMLIPSIKRSRHKAFIIVLYVIFILLFLNYREIINIIHEAFPGKISFIEKSFYLEQSAAGISNGRGSILTDFFSQYNIANFVFGIGIGKYTAAHNGIYSHNLFTSMLVEIGLIGFVFIVWVIERFIRIVIKYNDKLLIFLFSVSIIPLMFSNIFWSSFIFWMFLFVVVNYRHEGDEK